MIKKLKLKFIILSVTSLAVLLCIIVAGMNTVNYSTVVKDADTVLSLISHNHGRFPEFEGNEKKPEHLPPNMSPELPYESRYFSVLLNDSLSVVQVETSRIAAIDSEEAVVFANKAVHKIKDKGFVGSYRYNRINENGTIRITFLDCGRKLDAFYGFLFASCAVSLLGLIAVSAVIIIVSGRIIRPIAEAYEKQKRFITDAGHEIKTPLTIINANADILEMENGESEALEDIKEQTKRLTSLTNDLVYLARMEEADRQLNLTDFDISELLKESAASFKAVALSKSVEMLINVEPALFINADRKAINQLINILLDNAVKYAKTDSKVFVSLIKNQKNVQLSVSNLTESEINAKDIKHIFDRFYRIDPSRNSLSGGHGIGLSIAKAITEAHGGKILAEINNSEYFTIMAFL